MPRRPLIPPRAPLGDSSTTGSHLAISPVRGSAATPALEAELVTSTLTHLDPEGYDVEGMKKRIMVMFMEAFHKWMLSPHTPLEDKVTKGLAAMAQWEGTKRIIEWDKRKVDQKDLLERADKIAGQLATIRARLKPEDIAAAQLQASRVLLGDLGREKGVTAVFDPTPLDPPTPAGATIPTKEVPPDGRNPRTIQDQPAADPGGKSEGEPGAV